MAEYLMKGNLYSLMKQKIGVIELIFLILLSTSTNISAYDTNADGVDTLSDAIISINELRLKESIHTLQILNGMNPSPNLYFSRSDSGNIVTDLETNLMWQDSYPRFKTEEEGILHCNDFELDGYDDWRLPDFDELQSFFKDIYNDTSFELRYWGTFSGCTAAVAIDGYVKTPVGAERYGGEVGDRIYFSGGAAARCVRTTP